MAHAGSIMTITPFEIDTNQKSKFHRTYKGALAFALYRVQGWIQNNKICVDVNELKNKHSINYYDWDSIWLAMKIIPYDVITHQHGVRSARDMVKQHPKIAPYLKEWRKVRCTGDQELKEMFHVGHITDSKEIQEFIDTYKEWEEKDTHKIPQKTPKKSSPPKTKAQPIVTAPTTPVLTTVITNVVEPDQPPQSPATQDSFVFIAKVLLGKRQREEEIDGVPEPKRTHAH
jgi:hypothetical protein